MDYNNENEKNLSEINDSENTVEPSDSQNDDFPVSEEENNGEYVPQFGEIEGVSYDYESEPSQPQKKKFFIFRYINPSIFIAICVFLAAILAFGAYWIFGAKTITGTWIFEVPLQSESSTADEAEKTAQQYYVFDSADSSGKGTYHIYYDGAAQTGEYELSSKDNKKVLTLGNSELYYDVEGIKLFGNATLKLTQPEYTDQTTGQKVEEQTISLAQGKDPDYESQSMEDYKIDDKLVGVWEGERSFMYYGMYEIPYSEKVTVNDNGIIKIEYKNKEMGLDNTMYYAYSAKDGKMTVQRVTSDDKEEVQYKIKDNQLTFTDKTKSSLFYDEIFGDATYYKDGKKPNTNDDKKAETETTAENTKDNAKENSTEKTTAKTAETTAAE